eukprot:gnl/MRDRNA2_/MRDRNA2_79087_c0_seq1.p1 gnl/MRDRNA2_/MRDRNA2_79087_c0~~gnl/MRDRNA2_/MRDRNA2_79087_c0_seq1.p1  ORF type:complete len:104 (-),score=4.54 gnl/MRDRNA2_/MRDRNA2_79087_c0_seq1:136-447(-)
MSPQGYMSLLNSWRSHKELPSVALYSYSISHLLHCEDHAIQRMPAKHKHACQILQSRFTSMCAELVKRVDLIALCTKQIYDKQKRFHAKQHDQKFPHACSDTV